MRITVILTEAEHAEAKRKAGLIPLSRWVRSLIVDEVPEMEIAKKAYHEAKAIEAIEVGAPKKPVKQCEHGVSKGFHCWQCRGLAVINAKD